MPKASVKRLIECNKDQLIDLVLDIEKYPDFVPFCLNAHVFERNIVGDLNRRRGQVNSMDDRAGSKVVKAEVPLSEMFGYVTSLRTLSSGRATSTMEFSHYAETPSSISDGVISEIKGNNSD